MANPYEPLQSINIPLSDVWVNNILSVKTRIVVVPVIPMLTPFKNYIINLQDSTGTTKISFVATHRVIPFSSVLSTLGQSYYIIPNTDFRGYTAAVNLQQLIATIQSKDSITQIPDTYQLSAFQISDELNLEVVSDIEGEEKPTKGN